MKKIGVWIWGCLLGGMVAACGGRNGAHGEEPDFTGLDSLIQGWVDKGYYPGAAICVKQDTAVLFRKSYGAVSPDTPVYVASAGKWVAAAVVAAVVDRTELSWDDPVEKWLPEFKGDPKGVIPLRRLLSHTSGIRPYLPAPPGGQLQPFGFGRGGNLAFGHRIHARNAVRVWRSGHAGGRTHGRGGCGEGV